MGNEVSKAQLAKLPPATRALVDDALKAWKRLEDRHEQMNDYVSKQRDDIEKSRILVVKLVNEFATVTPDPSSVNINAATSAVKRSSAIDIKKSGSNDVARSPTVMATRFGAVAPGTNPSSASQMGRNSAAKNRAIANVLSEAEKKNVRPANGTGRSAASTGIGLNARTVTDKPHFKPPPGTGIPERPDIGVKTLGLRQRMPSIGPANDPDSWRQSSRAPVTRSRSALTASQRRVQAVESAAAAIQSYSEAQSCAGLPEILRITTEQSHHRDEDEEEDQEEVHEQAEWLDKAKSTALGADEKTTSTGTGESDTDEETAKSPPIPIHDTHFGTQPSPQSGGAGPPSGRDKPSLSEHERDGMPMQRQIGYVDMIKQKFPALAKYSLSWSSAAAPARANGSGAPPSSIAAAKPSGAVPIDGDPKGATTAISAVIPPILILPGTVHSSTILDASTSMSSVIQKTLIPPLPASALISANPAHPLAPDVQNTITTATPATDKALAPVNVVVSNKDVLPPLPPLPLLPPIVSTSASSTPPIASTAASGIPPIASATPNLPLPAKNEGVRDTDSKDKKQIEGKPEPAAKEVNPSSAIASNGAAKQSVHSRDIKKEAAESMGIIKRPPESATVTPSSFIDKQTVEPGAPKQSVDSKDIKKGPGPGPAESMSVIKPAVESTLVMPSAFIDKQTVEELADPVPSLSLVMIGLDDGCSASAACARNIQAELEGYVAIDWIHAEDANVASIGAYDGMIVFLHTSVSGRDPDNSTVNDLLHPWRRMDRNSIFVFITVESRYGGACERGDFTGELMAAHTATIPFKSGGDIWKDACRERLDKIGEILKKMIPA
jgi:hypothetical protein